MDIQQILAQLAGVGTREHGEEVRERVHAVAVRNRAKFAENAKHWNAIWNKRFKEAYGYDGLAELEKTGFNLGAAGRQLRERGFREDVTTSQLYSLTTGLITQNLSAAYQVVKTMYRDVAKILPSTKSEESYFPLQRTDVPVPVGDNEAAPSGGIGGNLTRIKNYRFARILEFSKTLADDDQTGQVVEVASNMGDKMGYAEEKWWAQQLIGAYVAGNIRQSGGIIPAECIAGQSTSDPNYGGPVTTAGPVSRDAIATLYTAADYVTDIEGDFGLVEVDCGVFANADKITVTTILKSDFNPATVGSTNTEGTVPGVLARNPLEDLFVAKFTRFFKYFTGSTTLSNSGQVWFLGEAGKIGAFQDREPLTVTMESPQAGKSWEANMQRWQAQRRFGAGVTLPEFALRGN